jgi:hypothetical protein
MLQNAGHNYHRAKDFGSNCSMLHINSRAAENSEFGRGKQRIDWLKQGNLSVIAIISASPTFLPRQADAEPLDLVPIL